jgi:hypothetical protein
MVIDNNFIVAIKFGLIDKSLAFDSSLKVLFNYNVFFNVGGINTIGVYTVIIVFDFGNKLLLFHLAYFFL